MSNRRASVLSSCGDTAARKWQVAATSQGCRMPSNLAHFRTPWRYPGYTMWSAICWQLQQVTVQPVTGSWPLSCQLP